MTQTYKFSAIKVFVGLLCQGVHYDDNTKATLKAVPTPYTKAVLLCEDCANVLKKKQAIDDCA